MTSPTARFGPRAIRSVRPSLCSTTLSWRCRSNVTTSAPDPSGAGSGSVSQPRAVSRRAACWSCGSGGASATASLPRSWACACRVSQVGGPGVVRQRLPPDRIHAPNVSHVRLGHPVNKANASHRPPGVPGGRQSRSDYRAPHVPSFEERRAMTPRIGRRAAAGSGRRRNHSDRRRQSERLQRRAPVRPVGCTRRRHGAGPGRLDRRQEAGSCPQGSTSPSCAAMRRPGRTSSWPGSNSP